MAIVAALGQILTNNAAWKLTKTRALIKVASQNLRRDTECLNAAATRLFRRSETQTYILGTHRALAAVHSVQEKKKKKSEDVTEAERAMPSAQEAWSGPAADHDP